MSTYSTNPRGRHLYTTINDQAHIHKVHHQSSKPEVTKQQSHLPFKHQRHKRFGAECLLIDSMRPLRRPYHAHFDRPYWKKVSQIHPSDDESFVRHQSHRDERGIRNRQTQKRVGEKRRKHQTPSMHQTVSTISLWYHVLPDMLCDTTVSGTKATTKESTGRSFRDRECHVRDRRILRRGVVIE
ncbi:hypothetical protein P171DRAFT_257315 [Karstenula rhodostoma CBS 690.94]|uniref:Uncharacterized protein n=1 Tax=Karstenula rhodostoma CBS 690.94 TaxID=1392251 RepID=A0A9P4PNV0_9PLEO|nr:hypothetical protein P171DRAFT_257315 [Karstenula rhodostoma CBS 690.94]